MPLAHTNDRLGECGDVFVNMRGEEDRAAFISLLGEDPIEGGASRRIKTSRGFIEEQDAGPANEGGSACHPALFTTGETANDLAGQAPKGQPLQNFAHRTGIGIEAGEIGEQALNGYPRGEAALLEHDPANGGNRWVGGGSAQHGGRPVRGGKQPGQDLEGGSLSGTIGPHERGSAPFGNGPADIGHRAVAPTNHAQVINGEGGQSRGIAQGGRWNHGASLGANRPSSCARRELSNNGVMKFPGEAAERIARCLLASGPATVAELSERLGMSSAALRRPLHALLDSGMVSAEDRRPYGPEPKKGRGRPSKVFALTEAGRKACDGGGDDLAIAALRYLAEIGGRDAVINFAKERALALVGDAPTTPEQVAARLTSAGYAAAIEHSATGGLQLCQHHCPAVDAAREFPELCEAESIVLSEALGRSVTRLATLQHGDAVCTAVLGAPTTRQPELQPDQQARPEQGRVPA